MVRVGKFFVYNITIGNMFIKKSKKINDVNVNKYEKYFFLFFYISRNN